MITEREAAQLTTTFIKVVSEQMESNIKITLSQFFEMTTKYMTGIVLGFLMILVVLIAIYLINTYLEHEMIMKVEAEKLEKIKRETYYWNVIGQCADIQLANLLDPPIQQKSKNESNAMEFTREHFDPRYYSGGIDKNDYE